MGNTAMSAWSCNVQFSLVDVGVRSCSVNSAGEPSFFAIIIGDFRLKKEETCEAVIR